LKAKLEKVQQAQYIEPESPTTFYGTINSIYESPITYEHPDSLQTFPFSPIKEKDEINENPNLEIIKPSQRLPIISIDTIKSQLEPDEIAFFEALDIELKKISEFYE
ncbi:13683_t:CDS:2, partial [Racocetra fulgida]